MAANPERFGDVSFAAFDRENLRLRIESDRGETVEFVLDDVIEGDTNFAVEVETPIQRFPGIMNADTRPVLSGTFIVRAHVADTILGKIESDVPSIPGADVIIPRAKADIAKELEGNLFELLAKYTDVETIEKDISGRMAGWLDEAIARAADEAFFTVVALYRVIDDQTIADSVVDSVRAEIVERWGNTPTSDEVLDDVDDAIRKSIAEEMTRRAVDAIVVRN